MFLQERSSEMIVIACVDDSMGMLFNNRRVSRDEKVIDKIVEVANGRRIWMSDYSQSLFEYTEVQNIIMDDNYLEKADCNEYCFVEKEMLSNYKDKMEKIILFKWNRDYPSDKKFDLDLTEWINESSMEFQGNSHECITMEVYTR